MIEGTKIIVGVTGSIAAYKSAYLVRGLLQRGADVRVAMTPSATRFIAPLTFSSLTSHPVAIEMYPDASSEASGSWHIDWALWADLMVIAPASASTIARLATGLSDNALTVIATALRGELFIAPAMDLDMYRYAALARNVATLRAQGVGVIPPGTGFLASGLHGEGRLAEPEDIIEHLSSAIATSRSLQGVHMLVTAGPTQEAVDPVRFLSNHSSGKMGYALASEAKRRGAEVTLVSGPVTEVPPSGIRLVRVTSAEEMATAVDAYRDDADVVIAAAAVADFTPIDVKSSKMKRREMESDEMTIRLKPTRDILRSIGENRRREQIIVGFALESENLLASARRKLEEKRCDLIVANSAVEEGSGFGGDENRITLVEHDREQEFPRMSKRECAVVILEAIERIRSQKNDHPTELPTSTDRG